jgi:hypothetical protein
MSLFKSKRVQALENKVGTLSSSLVRLSTQHYELSAQHARLLAHLKLYEHNEPAKTELRKGNPPVPTFDSYSADQAHNQQLQAMASQQNIAYPGSWWRVS